MQKETRRGCDGEWGGSVWVWGCWTAWLHEQLAAALSRSCDRQQASAFAAPCWNACGCAWCRWLNRLYGLRQRKIREPLIKPQNSRAQIAQGFFQLGAVLITLVLALGEQRHDAQDLFLMAAQLLVMHP